MSDGVRRVIVGARERALAAAGAIGTPKDTGAIESFLDRLWPLPRSITGEGVRRTHDVLGELAPLNRIEVPTGTECFDWTIPKEWALREAYVVTPEGRRILDVHDNNLHLVGYSVPFRGQLQLDELDAHLYSRPDLPTAIPYVTSYYVPRWGFCLPHVQRKALRSGLYDVVVDTELFDGSMTLSDAVIKGSTPNEVLFSTYTCHPSLANNELSGPLVTALVCSRLGEVGTRFTYRFAWLAETIGAIAYLSMNGEHLRRVTEAGYVMSCIGDAGPFTFKRSRRRDTLADRAALHCLDHVDPKHRVCEFDPGDGSDERQYCSPGFDLAVGGLSRSIYGSYPEYHTSLDDRSVVSPTAIAESVEVVLAIISVLEVNRRYRRVMPYGEPQLDRRGLYKPLGTTTAHEDEVRATLWVLNFSDGHHDLLDIAERSGYDIWLLDQVARRCEESGLLVADD